MTAAPPSTADVPALRLRTVPAAHGALWVRNGFRIFFHKPLAFCILFIVYLVAVQMLLLLWPIGTLVLFAAMPLASLGFMIATRSVIEGKFPLPRVFMEPLRREPMQRKAQLLLALIYAVATGLTVWLANVVGGAAFEALEKATASGQATPQTLEPLLRDPALHAGLGILLGVTSLVSLPFWHAPALVHWGRQSAAKALFSSTLACWRNKGAMAIYTMTWGGLILLFVIASQLVFGILGQPQMAMVAATPAGLLFATVFYASLYFSFADSFERAGAPGAETTPP